MLVADNTLSQIARNNLQKSQAGLSTSIQRLSSGLRVNSAKDDAAGYAIANRLTANINGLTQAHRNVTDAISLAQTTDGSLAEISENIQRVRQLTVQALNGTNAASDLRSIQTEINQRLAEIDRISQQTEFNGINPLSSSASALAVQAGSQDGQTITMPLREISTRTLRLTGFNLDGSATAPNAPATGQDLIDAGYTAGSKIGNITTFTKSNPAASLADAIQATKAGDTVTGTADGFTYVKDSDGSFRYNDYFRDVSRVPSDLNSLRPAAGPFSITIRFAYTNQTVSANVDADGNLWAGDGKPLYLDMSSPGSLSENNTSGSKQANINFNSDSGDLISYIGAAVGSITVGSGANAPVFGFPGGWHIAASNLKTSANALLAKASNDNASGQALSLSIGGSNYAVSGTTGTITTGGNAVYLDQEGNLTTSPSDSLSLLDSGQVVDGSGRTIFADPNPPGKLTLDSTHTAPVTADPLKVIDAALSNVDTARSALGALKNRLDSALSTGDEAITNLSSARSRIQDADYAVEMANLTRANILQQAGVAVLAQANQSSQAIVSLLR